MKYLSSALISIVMIMACGCGPITPPTPGPGGATFADGIRDAADKAYAELAALPPGMVPANDLAAAKAADIDIDSLTAQYDAGSLTAESFAVQVSFDCFTIYSIANRPAIAGKVNPPALLKLKSAARPAAKLILK